MPSIWDRYPDLTASELRELVAATAQVLAETADPADREQLPADPIDISTGEAARELAASIDDLDAAKRPALQEVLEDDELAVELCLAVLGQVHTHPELADAVEEAYQARRQKMTGAEVLLLAGALVVLAIRIKEIRVGGKQGTKITFAESGEVVKAFVTSLVNSLRG